MEELLVAVIQFAFELALELISYSGLDWPSRSRDRPEWDSLFLPCLAWFIGGCVLAGLSILLLKQTLIHWPVLRLTNLIVAPLASAFLSEAIARRRSRTNFFIVPRNHFWTAFWFTLGLVIVRFAYTAHI